jgi:thioredoxin reductase (NADPH)
MLSTQEVPTQEAEGQPQGPVADAPFSNLSTRMHQMFPSLTCAEIDRLRRFGEIGDWHAGELLFETGHTGPGMFVLLEGRVKVYQRDGIGREVGIFWPRSVNCRAGPRWSTASRSPA